MYQVGYWQIVYYEIYHMDTNVEKKTESDDHMPVAMGTDTITTYDWTFLSFYIDHILIVLSTITFIQL